MNRESQTGNLAVVALIVVLAITILLVTILLVSSGDEPASEPPAAPAETPGGISEVGEDGLAGLQPEQTGPGDAYAIPPGHIPDLLNDGRLYFRAVSSDGLSATPVGWGTDTAEVLPLPPAGGQLDPAAVYNVPAGRVLDWSDECIYFRAVSSDGLSATPVGWGADSFKCAQ